MTRYFRAFTRSLHSSRITRAGGAPWGTEVNEPGGRLFGEPIRKPGERRKLFDWEIPYIGTLVLAGVILGVGLNSRPDRSAMTLARKEAFAREATLGRIEDRE